MNKLTLIALLLSSTGAFSGECVYVVDRGACPGKEAEMLKPYNGINPTTEKKKFATLEECKKNAEEAAKIVRGGVLATKKLVAKFDGKEIAKHSFSKQSDCEKK